MDDHAATSPSPNFSSDEEIDRAIAAAVANAAFDGIVVEPDEQALSRRHLRGEISHEEFLRLALELAVAKAKVIRAQRARRHSSGPERARRGAPAGRAVRGPRRNVTCRLRRPPTV